MMKSIVFGALACAAVVNAATDPLNDSNDENVALGATLGVVGVLLCMLLLACAFYCSGEDYARKNTYGGATTVARDTVFISEDSSSSSYYEGYEF